ncbi:MAG: hypothetical protein H6586_09170 [Flavobacteriales bacterium]|nr:hypothetical protein [Leptospiraceae bacterium]MCB9336308.1 hypothetical protein [Flavobacteriales bacterium]
MIGSNLLAAKAVYREGNIEYDKKIFDGIQEAEIIITIIPKVFKENLEEKLFLSEAYDATEDDDLEEDKIWSSYLQ